MKHELPQLGKDFLNQLKVNEYSEHTIESYEQELHELFSFMVQHKSYEGSITDIQEDFIKGITIRDLNAFVAELSEKTNKKAKVYSSATKAKYIACIKSFFNFLDDNGIIKDNPTIKLKTPKQAKVVTQFLTAHQIEKILSMVEKDRNYIRNYAILIVFLNCGLRLSELIDLKLKDISKDKYGDRIKVCGKGNKERVVYLNEDCLKAINEYKAIRPKCEVDNLFVCLYKGVYKEMTPKSVQKMVKRLVKKAKLDKEIHVHSLRHTFATMAAANGADLRTLQDTMGHSDITTTQRYMHVLDENKRRLAQLVKISR